MQASLTRIRARIRRRAYAAACAAYAHTCAYRCGAALHLLVLRQDRIATRSELRPAVHVYSKGIRRGDGAVLLQGPVLRLSDGQILE